MKPMKDDCFVDSNIYLYILDNDGSKKSIAKAILKTTPTISTQVLNNDINVLFKKHNHFSIIEIVAHCKFLEHNCVIKFLNVATINKALFIKEKYQL